MAIIGAGVVGSAIARELARFDLRGLLIDKEWDVGRGTSSANSGVVHAGIYYPKDSLKAKYCVEGNGLFDKLCSELSVPFRRTGKLIVARNEEEIDTLNELKKKGDRNGARGLMLIGEREIRQKQPGAVGIKAVWSPSTGIVSPYELTIALADNAVSNGFSVMLGKEVTGIKETTNGYEIDLCGLRGEKTKVNSSVIINSAGVHSTRTAAMMGLHTERKTYPCRGEYLILDKEYGHLVNHPLYPVPLKGLKGLGVHITPTLYGNILIGPSAEYIREKEDTSTTGEKVRELRKGAEELLPPLARAPVIKLYAGIRSKITKPGGEAEDFIIDMGEDVINLIGIESPGLTAAPAIARKIAAKVGKGFGEKEDYHAEREKRTEPNKLTLEERRELVEKEPRYGEIVCRCEKVSYMEVLDALNNPFKVRSLAAVKYRTRATMGRCQGGFCTPRLVEIMRKELGVDLDEIYLKDPRSPMFAGETKSLRLEKKKEGVVE